MSSDCILNAPLPRELGLLGGRGSKPGTGVSGFEVLGV